MDIQLEQITTNDTMTMTRMYHSAFAGLYEKYHDDATSPFKETPQSILTKINTATHHYYFININQKRVGLIGLIQTESAQITRISPLLILPQYEGHQFAQTTLNALPDLFPTITHLEVDTILQEAKLVHLYEKCGFERITGKKIQLQSNMTLIFLRKIL